MLDERAGVAEVVDVFAGGALLRAAAAGEGVGPVLVEGGGVALVHLGEVGSDVVEVDLLLDGLARCVDGCFVDEDDRMAFVDGVAGRDGDLADDAAGFGVDLVLHLHGVHDEEKLAFAHGIARSHVDRDDGALQGGEHGVDAFGNIDGGEDAELGGGSRRGGGALLAMSEHGEGIAGIDGDARLTAGGRGSGADSLEEAPGMGGVDGVDEGGDVVVDETRVDAGRGQVGVSEDGLEQVDVGGDALDAEVGEGTGGAAESVGEAGGGGVADDLGEEGIEAGAGAVTGVAEGVGAHAGAGGDIEGGEGAAGGAGGTVGGHRLHVDARLDGETAGGGRLVLRQAAIGERLARGEAELELHEVDAGDLLRHGVLDLEAGVRLDEPELAAGLIAGVDDELEGAEVAVAAGPREVHGGSSDALAQVGGEGGSGAISMSFWWRRWILQSRSPKWVTAPSASPAICTSMCRARGIQRST